MRDSGVPVLGFVTENSQLKKSYFFHYARVSPGDSPLTKKPEDSEYEIGFMIKWSRLTQIDCNSHTFVEVNLPIRIREYLPGNEHRFI